MHITIFYSLDNAQKATGLTVVIDVFRAFSTACYAFQAGAEKIIPVQNPEQAYALQKENPEFLLMGEQKGKVLSGFDFGNSPHQIQSKNLRGKTIIHSTTMGTRGLVGATKASQIITGSFVNVQAIIDYITLQNPERVSLLCTGTANEHILDEDACCAEYIKNALQNQPNDFEKIVTHLKEAGFASHFFDPKIETHSIEDFDLCMNLNIFNFVLKAEPFQKELICLKPSKKNDKALYE